jgi:catechol 2,3-dioxygenase-like lactoylglutathione lyase family enzyme
MVANDPTSPFTHVDMVGLIVPDQDRALDWFTTKLGFEVREDNEMPDDGLGVVALDDALRGHPLGDGLALRLQNLEIEVLLRVVEPIERASTDRDVVREVADGGLLEPELRELLASSGLEVLADAVAFLVRESSHTRSVSKSIP